MKKEPGVSVLSRVFVIVMALGMVLSTFSVFSGTVSASNEEETSDTSEIEDTIGSTLQSTETSPPEPLQIESPEVPDQILPELEEPELAPPEAPWPSYGVYMENASVQVLYNTFKLVNQAIYFKDNSNATISWNTLENSYWGIAGEYSSPEISNNTLTNIGEDGIRLLDYANATVSYNNVTGSGGYGIYVYNSDILIDNNIFNNSGFDGIYVELSSGDITNNIAWNNGLWDIHTKTATVSLSSNDYGTLQIDP